MNMSTLNNQKGQFVVEAVLLLTVVMALTMLTRQFFSNTEFGKSLVSTPWQKLSGMIECGTWNGCAPGNHPSTALRALSFDPKGAQ